MNTEGTISTYISSLLFDSIELEGGECFSRLKKFVFSFIETLIKHKYIMPLPTKFRALWTGQWKTGRVYAQEGAAQTVSSQLGGIMYL